MRLLPLALLAAPLLLCNGVARAHAIESSLARVNQLASQLDLEAHFSNGTPLQGAAVRLIPPDGGSPRLVGRTDIAGRLRFQLPDGVQPDWEVQVDGGSGHRDYLELPGQAPSEQAAFHRVSQHGWARGLSGGLLALGALGGLIVRRRGSRRP